MKIFTLPLLAAAAIGAITMGSATAMPFSANNATVALDESLAQDVRVVCNSNGNCWNTNGYRSTSRYQSRRYYGGRGYYAQPGYGYGNGYYRGPRVGIGIGPVGIGVF
jgi:hypothetical protein